MTQEQLNALLNYVRSKFVYKYKQSSMFVEEKGLRDALKIPHKGFFIGINDPSQKEIIRDGFLCPNSDNVLNSVDLVIETAFNELKSENITFPIYSASSVHLTIITDCKYLKNPLLWNEKENGVYFQWGQKYHSLYLPYQIKSFNLTKSAILDRLCGWEAGLASSLWRLPESLIWELVAFSISS